MPAANPRNLVLEYVKHFETRDLGRCVSLFRDDATIHFRRNFTGRAGVERWHKERFEADLRIIRIEDISVDGEVVNLDVVISSKRLKAFRLNSVGARVTVRLKDGAVADVRFGVRRAYSSKTADQRGVAMYKAYVGPIENYDLMAAVQFQVLTLLGLREHHYFLDVGCGSLRGGKLFIPYLLAQRYYGMEPEQWLIDEGISNEIGKDLVGIKQPVFGNNENFTLSMFGREFDYILAQSIFSHASRAQITRCLQEARKVMSQDSIFVATFMEGPENYRGQDWLDPGPATYEAGFLGALVKDQGLCSKLIDWPHPNGQSWMVIFRPDRQNDIPDLPAVNRIHFR